MAEDNRKRGVKKGEEEEEAITSPWATQTTKTSPPRSLAPTGRSSLKGRTEKLMFTSNTNAAVMAFVKYVQQYGINGLVKRFNEELVHKCFPSKPAPLFEANKIKNKNRYKDVICLEETRVKLAKELPADGDYIHANYVKFPEYDRTYICTQGPLENTAEDFWRMVWQEKSPIVVNLTRCCEEVDENNKKDDKDKKKEKKEEKDKVKTMIEKCFQYWPRDDNQPLQIGRFSILAKKVDKDDKLTIYVLEVLPEGCSNSHVLRLIHITSWFDGKITKPRHVLKLIKKIYIADTLATEPIIIHCSAGIGRTGTMVLVDFLLYRLFRLGKVTNLEDAFVWLREQRASSVQTPLQFVFLVVCVARYIAVALKDPELISWAEELSADFKTYTGKKQ